MSDITDSAAYSVAGFLLTLDSQAIPCGYIAKSFFNGFVF